MKVTFLGLGSHAGNLIDICNLREYDIAGYIDNNVADLPYPRLDKVEGAAVLGFGGLTPQKLAERYKTLAEHEAHFVTLVHPSAILSHTALFGDGVQVIAGAIIQHNVQVDSGCIINTRAIIEHDAVIGKGCHIAPGATVLGGCKIGDFCFIGANAVIVQGSVVPAGTFIKAGSIWKS